MNISRRSSDYLVLVAVFIVALFCRAGFCRPQIVTDDDHMVTLRCAYEDPIEAYSRVTIQWRKEIPERPLYSPTLVTMVDFIVEGVADTRYGATPEGWLTIESPITLSDQGTYVCVVIFTLDEIVDGNGYITLSDRVELEVMSAVDQVYIYPKQLGILSGITGKMRMRGEPMTIVCNATYSKPAAHIEYTIINSDGTEDDIMSYVVSDTSVEIVNDDLVNSISEVTLVAPQDLADKHSLSVTCQAIQEVTTHPMTASLLVDVYPAAGKKKRKGKGRKGKKGRRQKKQKCED
ncbi:uncharacterized protein LOC144440230 [Glandiceps talaboti]